MKIKMLVDAPGSPDGVTVNQYAEGETYEVPADLGDVLVAEGHAERVQATKPKPERNKRGRGPRENKGQR